MNYCICIPGFHNVLEGKPNPLKRQKRKYVKSEKKKKRCFSLEKKHMLISSKLTYSLSFAKRDEKKNNADTERINRIATSGLLNLKQEINNQKDGKTRC